jgi:hypothetical protein
MHMEGGNQTYNQLLLFRLFSNLVYTFHSFNRRTLYLWGFLKILQLNGILTL